MKCINKLFKVNGLQGSPMGIVAKELRVIVTNDKDGKTLTVDNGTIQFTIPMDSIAAYLK